jgi:iron complex outermembrane receptor protein
MDVLRRSAMKATHRNIIALAVATALFQSQFAAAQSAADEPGDVKTMATLKVEDVAEPAREVAVTKSDVALIETPQAISVVTGETIQELNLMRIGEVLERVAGISHSSTYGFYDAYTLRGYDAAYGTIYLDGLSTTSVAGTTNELAGLERVEVVKGPAAALYGASPLGGIVNLTSKRPTDESFVETNLATGSWNLFEAHIDGNSPLNSSGSLLGRVNLLYRDADDFVENSGENRLYIAPTLTWNPAEDTSLTFLGRYQRDRDTPWSPVTGYGTILPSAHGDLPIDFSANRTDGDRPVANQERRQFGYVFDHRFNEHVSISQTARYARTQTFWNNWVFTDEHVDHELVGGAQQGHILTLYVYGPFRQLDKDSGIDTRIKLDFATGALTHKLTFGVDYKRNENTFSDDGGNFNFGENFVDVLDPRGTWSVPLLHDPSFANSGEGQMKSIGFYAQEHVGLPGERWFVTLGARYDDVDVDGQKDHAVSPNVGVSYLVTPGVAIYANAAKPFTPQGSFTLDRNDNALPPEEGRNVEIGVKWNLPDRELTGMVSLFQLVRENVATSDPDPAFPFAYVVTGEQRSRGFEIEGTWRPAPAWTATWAYTWLDAEITEDNTLVVGTRLSNIPKHNIYLFGEYELQDGPLAGLAFNLSGVHNSPKNTSLFPYDFDGDGVEDAALPLPSYTLVDAGVSYGRDAWDVRLTVNNLLDERYFPDGGFYTRITPGEPRNWVLSATYRY